MATTIRLTRMGKKKRPFYRLVVMDSRRRRDGAYLANLGYYNPFVEPHEVRLHTDEIITWLQKGAELSETARALLRSEGVLYQFSLMKTGLGTDEIQARMDAWRPQHEARRERERATIEAHRRQLQEAEEQRREAAAKTAAEAAAGEAAEQEASAADETAPAEGE